MLNQTGRKTSTLRRILADERVDGRAAKLVAGSDLSTAPKRQSGEESKMVGPMFHYTGLK